ncbi:MAG: hypothetical protein IKU86_03535 [Thermoguttaceae bacterium]|nr:hypothetical protein [Thermoguttaceae bacterium]
MIYRLVDRDADGEPRVRDFADVAELSSRFEKIGVDDCSADLRMRGYPIFRGLIGPMPECDGTVARYETPEIFEKLTKEWSATRRRKARRNRAPNADATP